MNDRRHTVRCHLGRVLRPGDSVLGFDLRTMVFNDADAEDIPEDALPRALRLCCVVLPRASHWVLRLIGWLFIPLQL